MLRLNDSFMFREALDGVHGLGPDVSATLHSRFPAISQQIAEHTARGEYSFTALGKQDELVDRLLDPAPPRPHAPLNIHAVLERVLRLAEAEAGWAVKLVRDYDPSLPDLDGDADRLAQAAWNLVRNAIQAGAAAVTLRTRIERDVRIGEEMHARALRLEIIDDGRGVPAELAEQIFLPLVSGRADGTGLGLALAQQVVREHRGALAYRSRPGHTVFALLLPLAAERGAEGEQQ